MKSLDSKNLLFSFLILFAFSACSEKGKGTVTENSKADSISTAQKDSIDLQEGKEVKDVIDVVKR